MISIFSVNIATSDVPRLGNTLRDFQQKNFVIGLLFSDNVEKIICYTCMSENVPEISKHILSFTVNLPDYAQSSICNDPFSFSSMENFKQSVKLEECDTACVKFVSESRRKEKKLNLFIYA